MAERKRDQDEAALSSLESGRPEALLALKLTTALLVARLHDLENVSVVAAIDDLTTALLPFLAIRGKAAFSVGEGRVYLNGRAVRAGQAGGWVDNLVAAFERAGIGGLILSGTWSRPAVRGLLSAFAAGSSGVAAVAHMAGLQVQAPARADVLDVVQAKAFAQEEEEGHLASTERAAFYYARLVALAEASLCAVAEGRAPDVHPRSVRQTFMKVVDYLDDPMFERRLLAMTLLPPLEDAPLASHLANVAVLSIPMGRLLGLSRGRLTDLGFAAFFHDLGWAGTGKRSAGEPPHIAHAHVARGVARALRSRSQGDAALVRLLVAQEHHAKSDGYPEIDREPHPYSQIVGLADAFDQLAHGAKATEEGPAAALQSLSDNDAFEPAVVALLWDVLGRYPCGSVLRLTNGSVVGVIDGGARRGDRPIARRIMGPDGGLDEQGTLIEIPDVDEVEQELDGSMFGRGGADVVFLRSRSSKTKSGAVQTAWLPDRSGKAEHQRQSRAYEEEELQAIAGLLEDLQKAVRFFRLYPHDHPNCESSIAVVKEGLSLILHGADSLEVRVQRDGLTVSDTLVLESSAHHADLANLLYPAGVRALTFEAGVTAQELHEFVATLSGQGDEEVHGSEDLHAALWRHELPHIGHTVHDPLTPGAVAKLRDPLLLSVAQRITQQMNGFVGRFDIAEPGLAEFVDSLESVELDPELWGAVPDRVQEFLASPEGEDRSALVRAAYAFYRNDLQRSADVVHWALGQQESPHADDAGSFFGGAVLTALWREDLEVAEALTAAAMTAGGSVAAAVSRCLTSRSSLRVLARLLRGHGEDDPETALGLRILEHLGDSAVEPVCQAYPHMDAEVRKGAFWSYLAENADTTPEPLKELSQHDDENISREAMLALAQGSEGSEALAFLMTASETGGNEGRAAAASKLVQSTSGGTRKGSLETLQSGDSKRDRLHAAEQLRTLGDIGTYEQLCVFVKSRRFGQRDEDEQQAVLGTLVALGGTRSARVLEELGNASGLLGGEKMRRTSRLAKAAMDELRAKPKGKTDAGTLEKGVCPRCKFRNVPGVIRCLSCGYGGAEPKKRKKAAPAAPSLAGDDASGDLKTTAFRYRGGGRQEPGSESESLPLPVSHVLSEPGEGAVEAWLTCAPFKPVPLGTKPVLKIGRGGDCDLVLAHQSVSRVHVLIRSVGETRILDDRSSYGTWVNGKRVMTSALHSGDVITIGPYDITIEGPETALLDSDTRPLRTFASSDAISGRLESVPLAEVFQQIEFNSKTGTLEVFSADSSGVLVIYEGKPMYAELGEERDDEAVLSMLKLERGTFSFRGKIEAGEKTMESTLTSLLFEASRQLDEADA